jgi:hypothetical protein
MGITLLSPEARWGRSFHGWLGAGRASGLPGAQTSCSFPVNKRGCQRFGLLVLVFFLIPVVVGLS